MNFNNERYGIAEKLTDELYTYRVKNNRNPDIILIDVISLYSLCDKNSAIMIPPNVFKGVRLQALDVIGEFWILQRSKPEDILSDVEFKLERQKRDYENMLKNYGLKY